MKKKILSVRIEHKSDESPDTSYLGKYSDQITGVNPYAIIRVGEYAGKFVMDLTEDEQLPDRCRKYRFFLPCHENYVGLSEQDTRKYCLQDFARMEGLSDGQWQYIGVIAKAEIASLNGLTQTIRSGGLWGVESDSGKDYLAEIAEQELSQLRDELTGIGFGKRAIDYAFKSVETISS